MRNITVSNVICNANEAIIVGGYLTDSTFSNIVNKKPDAPTFVVKRENGLNNVKTENIVINSE